MIEALINAAAGWQKLVWVVNNAVSGEVQASHEGQANDDVWQLFNTYSCEFSYWEVAVLTSLYNRIVIVISIAFNHLASPITTSCQISKNYEYEYGPSRKLNHVSLLYIYIYAPPPPGYFRVSVNLLNACDVTLRTLAGSLHTLIHRNAWTEKKKPLIDEKKPVISKEPNPN